MSKSIKHSCAFLIAPDNDSCKSGGFIRHFCLSPSGWGFFRRPNILIEAPHGKACAYKEMGKCPAPCDGSISMDSYRLMIDWSARVLADPGAFIQEQRRRMEQAAAELRFESAARIKAYIEQLGRLGTGPFRHVRPLERFIYVSLQPGPRSGTAKLFLIIRGRISEVLGLIAPPEQSITLCISRLIDSTGRPDGEIDPADVECMAIVANHLFRPRRGCGVLLHVDDLDGPALAAAWRELRNEPAAEEINDEQEGLLKELQGP